MKKISFFYKKFYTANYLDRSIYWLDHDVNLLNNESKAFKDLKFDSLKLFKKYGTGNCVGISLILKEKMKNELNLNFNVIPFAWPLSLKVQKSGDKWLHAALLGKFEDAFILIDPTNHFSYPIIIKEEKFSIYQAKKRSFWRFEINKDDLQLNVSKFSTLETLILKKEDPAEQCYAPLLEITNPDEIITKSSLRHDPRFLMTKFEQEYQDRYFLVMDFNTKEGRFQE